jgi:HlyD family secretion protein
MASTDFGAALNDIEVLFAHGTAAGLTDVHLLERFLVEGGDAGEAAFTALVKRHGPMVLRVCRGELHNLHAAEDAFQATFLILARQARSIHHRSSLASWLYGVARRVARRARLDRARRAARERLGARMIEDQVRQVSEPPELLPEVQEEVDRLPERYRSPIVLCYLEGRTHEEAANQLRIPVGTVKIRLSRGRERLRGRLLRRGLAPAVAASSLSATTRAAIPAPLLEITVKAAMRVAASRATGVSATVAALAQGVLRAMLIQKLRTVAFLAAVSSTLIVASLVVVSAFSTPVRSEQEPERKVDSAVLPKPKAVAHAETDHPKAVEVLTIKKSAFHRRTNQPGTVEPSQKVDVLPTASGNVSQLLVDIGSAVKKGDLLAVIEAPELRLDVARSEALVSQAKARIQTAKSRVQVAESAVRTAMATMSSSEAALNAAEAQVTYRKKQAERLRQLFDRQAVEHRLLEEEEERLRAVEAEAFAAKVQVTVTKAAIEEARAKVQAAMADIGENQEGLRLTELDREKAQTMQNTTRIRSPIDGIVTRRTGHVGEFLRSASSGGSLPIFTIVQTSTVRIVTLVPDADVPNIAVGDPATFEVDALPGREYKGTVSRTAVALEPGTRTMRVEIDLDNPDGRLRPGMYGRVEIRLATLPDAVVISIPNSALISGTSGSYCFVVFDGHAVATMVSVDSVYANNPVVLSGLKEGDVVVQNAAGVQHGQEIKFVPAAAPR